MIVVRGPLDKTGFSESLSESLDAPLVEAEHKLFPDGESYVRIPVEGLDGEVAVLVQPTHYPQDKGLVELMLLSDAARELGAGRIIAVIPYLAYARQDKVFRRGEPVSIRVVLRALAASGIDEVYVIEPHAPAELNYFPGRAEAVRPMRYMARLLRGEFKNPLVLSPDLGGLERAREFAEELEAEFDYLVKHRDRVTGEVTMKPKILKAEGRDAVIVDDIISTGGTMAKAARMLLEQGARRVYAVCVHALLVGNALAKLVDAGIERIIAANTVPTPPGVEVLDIAPMVSGLLKSSGGASQNTGDTR